MKRNGAKVENKPNRKNMGRYYSGDINGKFWFGVQLSGDASFFGGHMTEPNYLEFSFDSSHQKAIDDGIAECLAELGDRKEKLGDYFRAHNGYTDKELAEAVGVKEKELNNVLAWYARLELGEKIRKCVEENGECTFEAEL